MHYFSQDYDTSPQMRHLICRLWNETGKQIVEGEWEHESTAGSRIDSVMILLVGESSSFRLLDDLICLTS